MFYCIVKQLRVAWRPGLHLNGILFAMCFSGANLINNIWSSYYIVLYRQATKRFLTTRIALVWHTSRYVPFRCDPYEQCKKFKRRLTNLCLAPYKTRHIFAFQTGSYLLLHESSAESLCMSFLHMHELSALLSFSNIKETPITKVITCVKIYL